jgi:magnesium-transporting ATPase (P-type)
MINLQRKSTKEKLNYLQTHKSDKGVFKKNILGGSIVATIIAATPLMFNLYQGVPETKVWDTFLFTYESGWYESVAVSAWSLTTSIIPLILLFLWFFTNKNWWYHALLVPIAMYIYQVIEILNGDLIFTDTNLILYLLPVMAIIVPSIYLIKAQMFNKINDAGKTMEELEEEFKIKPKGFMEKLGDYF